jgi:hypothetical protein
VTVASTPRTWLAGGMVGALLLYVAWFWFSGRPSPDLRVRGVGGAPGPAAPPSAVPSTEFDRTDSRAGAEVPSAQASPATETSAAENFGDGGALPNPLERGSLLEAPALYQEWCMSFGFTATVLEADTRREIPDELRRAFEGALDSPWATPCLWLYPPTPAEPSSLR